MNINRTNLLCAMSDGVRDQVHGRSTSNIFRKGLLFIYITNIPVVYKNGFTPALKKTFKQTVC